MKIKLSEIRSIAKILEKIPYNPVNEKSKFFFEIDCGKVVDDGSFVMEVKDKNVGAASLVKPGLTISLLHTEKKDRTIAGLIYAQVDYAPKFNLDSYLDILGIKLSSKDRQTLSNLDVYLVKKEYILSEFDI